MLQISVDVKIQCNCVFLFQASEFFMFGILMLLDMCLFSFLAYRYKYVEYTKRKNEEIQLEETVGV